MTPDEFNGFLADFWMRFPDDHEWLAAHPATVRLWYDEIFAALPLDECLRQTKWIFAGREEKWTSWQRDQIGAIIAKPVRRRIGEQSEHEREKARLDADTAVRRRRPFVAAYGGIASLAAAYRRACELRHSGASEEVIQEAIDEAFR